MCGPGVEAFEELDSEEEHEILKKLIVELKEQNRLAQLYYKEKQWSLLEKVTKKINIWSHMISTHMDGMSEEGLLMVDDDE